MSTTWNAGENVEQPELSYIACGSINGRVRQKQNKTKKY